MLTSCHQLGCRNANKHQVPYTYVPPYLRCKDGAKKGKIHTAVLAVFYLHWIQISVQDTSHFLPQSQLVRTPWTTNAAKVVQHSWQCTVAIASGRNPSVRPKIFLAYGEGVGLGAALTD